MNKLFTRIAKFTLGLAMAIGVGAGIGFSSGGISQAWAEDNDVAPVNTVLWGENFAHFGTKTPSAAGTGTGTTIYDNATITYAQTSNNTKGYDANLAGGTTPELLLSKSNQKWTISGIKTGSATEMSLAFLSNKTAFSITCSSDAYTVSGSQKSWTITLNEGQTAPETFNITFENTAEKDNARIDNIELKVTKAGESPDPGHTHILVHYDRIEPTCTESGNIEYWKCSVETCGKMFSNSTGTTEITDPTLHELGHDMSGYSDNGDGTHSANCQREGCVYFIKENHTFDDPSGGYITCNKCHYQEPYVAPCYKLVSELGSLPAKFLIVHNKTNAFDGEDGASDYVSVTDVNGVINDSNGAAVVEIDSMDGGYSVKITNGTNAGKYIYGKSGSNSIQFGASKVANEITFDNQKVAIVSNSASFRYNSASGNDRFRFYKTETTGSSYVFPYLYKEAQKYTVTLNPNNEINEPKTSNVIAGSTYTVPSCDFTVPTGKEFSKWSVTGVDGKTSANPGDTFTMPDAPVTLTAQWVQEVPKFKLTYIANNGTQDKTETLKPVGETITISQCGFDYDGYTFANWSVTGVDGKTSANPGDTFTMPSNEVTLTANWNIINYNVTYAKGGGTGNVPTDSNVYNINNKTVTVLGNSGNLKKVGNTFVGWKNSVDSIVYTEGQTFTISSNVTLTATWAEATVESVSISLKNPEKEYREFEYLGVDDFVITANYDNGDSKKITTKTDVTIFVNDVANNPLNEGDNQVYVEYENISSNILNITATGAIEYEYTKVTSTTELADGDIVVFRAVKKDDKNDIDSASGGLTSTYLDKVDIENGEDDYFTSKTAYGLTVSASNGNYTFSSNEGTLVATANKSLKFVSEIGDGQCATWTISFDEDENATVASTTDGYGRFLYNVTSPRFVNYTNALSATMILPQLYKRVYYGVTYNGNGAESGTVPIDSNKYLSGDEATVLGNTGGLSKTNYVFSNWNTEANGTGDSYSPNEKITVVDNITLYAQYVSTSEEFTVSFDITDGEGKTPDPIIGSAGSVITLPDSTGFENEGYTLVSWNDGPTKYSPKSEYTISKTVTLVAEWKFSGIDTLNGIEAHMSLAYVYNSKTTTGSSIWKLVENANSLKTGDQIVIASNAKGKINGKLSSDYLGDVDSTFSSDKKTITSLGTDSLIFTLGGSSGAWTLLNGENSLGATEVKKLAWNSGTTTWSISISSNGDATIQNTTEGNGRFLHNVNSNRFTTYTSAPNATMLLPQIYRLETETTTEYSNDAFRMKAGINNMENFVASFNEGKSSERQITNYGIKISRENKPDMYINFNDSTYSVFDKDKSIEYVVLNLGNALTALEDGKMTRLNDEFTICAYVEFDDQIYCSEKSSTHSVASLTKYYVEKLHIEKLRDLYNICVEQGYIIPGVQN